MLFTKIHSFLKQCSSFHEKKVLQLMSAGASLERLGEKTLFSYNKGRAKTALKTNGLYYTQSLSIRNTLIRNHPL